MVEWDVIVVGSGAAGLTAAVTAARRGAKVLLLEKTSFFGGTTAISGGGIWIPGNHHAEAACPPEPPGAARRYIQNLVPHDLRLDVLDSYLQAGPEMLRFLERETEVAFALADHSPDWHPEIDGASTDGRLLRPLEYSAGKLGAYFEKLRPPRAEFNAPGGFMIDLPDLPHIANAKSSAKSAFHLARLALRFAWDKLRGLPRGSRLTMGNALVARLLRSALDAGVTLWPETEARAVMREAGRVIGVQAECNGTVHSLRARCGVVLASGGFSANAQLRRAYMPYPEAHVSIMAGCNTGDGMNIGLDAGGALDGENMANGVWAVASTLQRPDGMTAIYAHLIDMAKPGCIAVDKSGRRFGNEASVVFVEYMHEADAVPAWLIADARFLKAYGLGMVFPGAVGLKKLLDAGYVFEAPSLAALARRIGVDACGLQATAAEMNRFAASGKDSAFHKGDTALDRDLGDPKHGPNPCLGTVEKPPFYAVKILPGDGSTTVGLRIDAQARVLDSNDSPVPGLYAAGLDANSIWRGAAPAHGCNVGPAMTLGYIAARSLTAE